MLLVAYLKRLHAEGRPPTPSDRTLLAPMIQHSANRAATAVYWRAGGDTALYRLARSAAMKRFDVYGSWGARKSPPPTRLASSPTSGPSRRGASAVTPASSFPQSCAGSRGASRSSRARVGKPSSREAGAGPRAAHTSGRPSRAGPGASIAIAFLTDANQSHGNGRDSVRGLAAHLLRVARGPGKPWLVPLPDWFWGWARWYLHRSEFRNEPVRSLETRPTSAPRRVPLWAWARLKALLLG
jgi:hypothetical protein